MADLIRNIKRLETMFNERRIARDLIESKVMSLSEKINDIEDEIEDVLKAKEILVQIGLETQKFFKKRIEKLVTSTLRGVFERGYQFIMEVEVKYNRTVATPMIKKGDLVTNPKGTMGGGVKDVAALACRIVLLMIEMAMARQRGLPPILPIVFLDEPFRFLHGFEKEASKVIKRLSENFGLQFIIVSQLEALTMSADRVFYVDIKNGISVVEIAND